MTNNISVRIRWIAWFRTLLQMTV